MLYKIAHIFRDRIPWLWDAVNAVNSCLFAIKYERALKKVEAEKFAKIENKYCGCESGVYKIARMRDIDANKMVNFFARQPHDAFQFFRPHGFDVKSIHKLQKNKAFLSYVIIDSAKDEIVGYCFNRSFFHGKGFRGRIVDIKCRGKGIGTMMNSLLNEIGFGIGLKLFETVSKDNVASYRSAVSASGIRVVKKLPHNELFLEILDDMYLKNNRELRPIGGGKIEVVNRRSQPTISAYDMQERRAA